MVLTPSRSRASTRMSAPVMVGPTSPRVVFAAAVVEAGVEVGVVVMSKKGRESSRQGHIRQGALSGVVSRCEPWPERFSWIAGVADAALRVLLCSSYDAPLHWSSADVLRCSALPYFVPICARLTPRTPAESTAHLKTRPTESSRLCACASIRSALSSRQTHRRLRKPSHSTSDCQPWGVS